MKEEESFFEGDGGRRVVFLGARGRNGRDVPGSFSRFYRVLHASHWQSCL